MLKGEKGTYYHMPYRYTMMIKRGMHVKRVCKIMSRNSHIFSLQISKFHLSMLKKEGYWVRCLWGASSSGMRRPRGTLCSLISCGAWRLDSLCVDTPGMGDPEIRSKRGESSTICPSNVKVAQLTPPLLNLCQSISYF